MAVLGVGGQLKLRRQPVEKTLYLNESYIDTACNKVKGGPSWLWNGDKVSVIGLPVYCDAWCLPRQRQRLCFVLKWFLGPTAPRSLQTLTTSTSQPARSTPPAKLVMMPTSMPSTVLAQSLTIAVAMAITGSM